MSYLDICRTIVLFLPQRMPYSSFFLPWNVPSSRSVIGFHPQFPFNHAHQSSPSTLSEMNHHAPCHQVTMPPHGAGNTSGILQNGAACVSACGVHDEKRKKRVGVHYFSSLNRAPTQQPHLVVTPPHGAGNTPGILLNSAACCVCACVLGSEKTNKKLKIVHITSSHPLLTIASQFSYLPNTDDSMTLPMTTTSDDLTMQLDQPLAPSTTTSDDLTMQLDQPLAPSISHGINFMRNFDDLTILTVHDLPTSHDLLIQSRDHLTILVNDSPLLLTPSHGI